MPKSVTQVDVAREAGHTLATVREVYRRNIPLRCHAETRAEVLAAAARIGYKPAARGWARRAVGEDVEVGA